jgi:hypothetical protein
MMRCAFALAALVLLAPCGADAQAEPMPSGAARRDVWLGAEVHGSFFGDLQDRSTVLPRFGYGVRAGRRWGRYGLFGLVDRDHWIVSELDVDYSTGVLNLALGAELLFASGRVSASIALGVSILLQDQVLDDKGATGLYIAIRPTSLRYAVRRRATVQLDLLSLVVEAPVLRHPVLVEVQYRVAVSVEYGL